MEDHRASLAGTLLEQRYRVEALLARGGMSSVYRGLDTRLDRPVAVKIMNPQFADDRSFVERFEREARSAARIHHSNVVAVHDQGLDGDHVYLVMELVHGGTLRDLIRERGALGVPLALSIMEPLLAALAAAHQARLVHRDVKPENVLIGAGGVVKVGDFGLVRAIASAGTTSSRIILGTVAYLSPEQVTTGAATAQGDVYSAGVVLYEMLTGSVPYTGDTPLSIAYRHVNDDIPVPSTVLPQAAIPPALDDLVLRATRREPATRPVDAGAFLHELRRIRATLAVPWMLVPVPTPALVDHQTVRDCGPNLASGLVGPAGADASSPDTSDADADTQTTLAPVAAAAATVVRNVPAGFQTIGPQGTRAMLRSDLGPALNGGAPVLAQPPPPSPPWGLHQPPTPPVMTPPPAPKPSGRPSPARRIAVWSIVGVLLLALISTGTWWFTTGRWTDVPRVAGAASADAEQVLAAADLNPKITHVRDNEVAAGIVIRTEPAGGGRALRGDQVTLVVSVGRPRVPDVQLGTTVEAAQQAILAEDLRPQRDDGASEYHDTVAKGQVIKLSPQAGTQLNIGESVTIVVSDGPRPKPVPDVRGKTRAEAFQALSAAGFEPYDAGQEFSDIDGGRVVRTTPATNTEIKNGQSTRVGVVVSNAVTMPDLTGQLASDATSMLQGLGLVVQVQPAGPVAPTNRVYGQSLPPNSRVPPGSAVVLVVLG